MVNKVIIIQKNRSLLLYLPISLHQRISQQRYHNLWSTLYWKNSKKSEWITLNHSLEHFLIFFVHLGVSRNQFIRKFKLLKFIFRLYTEIIIKEMNMLSSKLIENSLSWFLSIREIELRYFINDLLYLIFLCHFKIDL